MNMLYILIPIALIILCIGIWALFWAIRNRQFDDLDAQAWSVVLDDDRRPPVDERGDEESGVRENAESSR